MTRVRRLLLALLLGLGLTLGAWPAVAAEPFPRTSARWQTCVKRLDGITTRISRSQRTVIVVNQTSRTYARVSFWVRREAPCTLARKFLTTTARIGQNGTVAGTERRQGSMTTPRGTYTITETFGNGPAAYTSMPYTRRGRATTGWVTAPAGPTTRCATRVRAGSGGGCPEPTATRRRTYGRTGRSTATST
jgi:L,D-peptidoglycan transpeptidase YkuD (ErfK/YbiS/YcfS/YnhG family)